MKAITKETIDRYVEMHIPTGGFLRAVLANDLIQASGRADVENKRDLAEIVSYIYFDTPAACNGSYAIVEKWLKGDRTNNNHAR